MMNDDVRQDKSSSDDRWKTDVENLCQRFRNRWQSDHRLTVERFVRRLGSGSPPESVLLPPLIEEEIRLRFAADLDLDYHDYEQRFPGFARVILSIFQELKPAERVIGATAWQIGSGELSDIQSLDESAIPERLDQYEVFEKVGEGAFGIVYRAMDHDRNLEVALKFPRSRVINSPAELDAFFEEAKNARSLEHEGIVKTFGLDGAEGYVFIVQKFVRGMSLAEWLKRDHTTRGFIQLMVGVANAAAYAHNRKIYHRDLKPSNIMVAENGTPLIADFGLAIHEDVQRRHEGRRCGSAAFMSPELAEGWAHLIDGRSDIWSIGVIIYKALTGANPFRGDTRDDFLEDIKERPVKPPRMIEPEIDKELQRICLRCLNKPIRERYLTGDELARDLEDWLGAKPKQITKIEIPVVPQGWRSFDANDAEFFLQLLPGPRDRHGMPDSIRFWKSKIEPEDGKPTIPVGVIFGPSGSGKSSFVKAGLLPRLNKNSVRTIDIEATSRDTEVRLIRRLRDEFSSITEEMSLPEAFDFLKSPEAGPKQRRTLVVIDQFEQWLHSNIDYAKSQLASALRHCDGENLQCILLVRDDFWVSISRFLNVLEIDLREGENAWRVDRFPLAHARNVLIKFGRAYEQLSQEAGEITPEQEAFLDQAIGGLSEESRVISVRLSIFAEMFKDRPWTRKELNRVGGTFGVGERFLFEKFESKDASPERLRHATAAKSLLESLLPSYGTDIRRHMRSKLELLEESPYSRKPGRFDELINLLSNDLRLIKLTDPDAIEPCNVSLDSGNGQLQHYYQLTHDYLVPSIRDWLLRDRRQTWRGRAKIRVETQASEWNRTKETRSLPTLAETCLILAAIPKRKRSDSQRAMMSAAKLRYGTRIAWFGSFVFALTLLVGWLVHQNLVRAQMGRLEVSDHHRGAVVMVARISDNLRIEEAKEIGKAPVSIYLPPGLYRVTIESNESRLEATSFLDAGAVDVIEVNVPCPKLVASLVEIKGGEYELGTAQSTYPLSAYRKSKLNTYRISPTEVSNREYREYVVAVNAPAPTTWPTPYEPTLDDLPVTGVSWDQANLYCRWRGVRLPTPDEWEVASKGPRGAKFPWGNGRNKDIRRNETPNLDFAAYRKFARPVGSDIHLATPLGIKHMLSNVQEYTEGVAVDRNRGLIVKGRSWRNSPFFGPSDMFTLSSRSAESFDRGFRIAFSTKCER